MVEYQVMDVKAAVDLAVQHMGFKPFSDKQVSYSVLSGKFSILGVVLSGQNGHARLNNYFGMVLPVICLLNFYSLKL